jgi:hypothetical protein
MSHTYKNYDEASKATLAAHRKMMDDFNEKYPTLSKVADTLLYPDLDAAQTAAITAFQKIFDGLENSAPVKELKCPGAPLRKQEYRN